MTTNSPAMADGIRIVPLDDDDWSPATDGLPACQVCHNRRAIVDASGKPKRCPACAPGRQPVSRVQPEEPAGETEVVW